MSRAKKLPSQSVLKSQFHYNLNTGELWCLGCKFSMIAGTKRYWRGKPSYISVYISGYGLFVMSRVIWKWMTGKDPINTIDHVNNNPFDNRWTNLRGATPTEQNGNLRIRFDNQAGYKGIYLTEDGTYMSRIQKNGKVYYLGRFKTAWEAHQAYCKAAAQLYGQFANYG